MDKKLGTLRKISDLREFWPHEALNFTPWLAEEGNIVLLGDAIGLNIVVEETESSVGNFSVDIMAREVGTDRVVIIENQLEETDHDHLGKIITYASGKDANYVVWIVRNAREEHRRAIEWLNNRTDDAVGFFLIELELWCIDDSAPAVRFQVVEQPNGWVKEIKRTGAGGDGLRGQYWSEFVECAFADAAFSKTFRCRKPGNRSWYDLVPNGIRSFSLSAILDSRKETIGIEIYISDNKDLFQRFLTQKMTIEATVGQTLDWQELPNRKASRIVVRRSANIQDRKQWNECFAWYQTYAEKMLRAFSVAAQ